MTGVAPGPASPLTALADDGARFGSRPALVLHGRYRRRVLTYRQLAEGAAATGARLTGAGITPGDRLLLRGQDSPEWVVAFLGCLRAGAVPVPLDASCGDRLASSVRDRAGCRGAFLPEADPWEPGIPRFPLELTEPARDPAPPPAARGREDILEIVFTSGTTGEPRGVTLTHENVLAYMEPIERGYRRRRWYVDPLLPIPVLCLPPLSHLFGQAVGLFLPLRLGCTVVFVEVPDPATIRRAVRSERVWLVMAVPRMMTQLAGHVRGAARTYGWGLPRILDAAPGRGLLRRLWAARRIGRWLGWRLRGFVVGGARLGEAAETFWTGLGYLVVQGYGLTETAPVVTLTHPFRPRPGSVGRPLGEQEVRLAPDGELLVRGRNVMRGYWNDPEATSGVLDPEGWLHTGDLARRDPDGSFRIVGRKKELIVLADGRNVHPEDVEGTLTGVAGVRDAVVVAAGPADAPRVHAVLLLDPGTDPATVVRAANEHLEGPQRVRSFTVWAGGDLPRTPTGKVRRREVERALDAAGPAPALGPQEDPVREILVRAGADPGRLREDGALDDLGLASLDLVEVAAALEERFGIEVPDGAIAGRTPLRALRDLASGAPPPNEPEALEVPLPGWPRRLPVRILRRLAQDLVILPATALVAPLRIRGTDRLRDVRPPALVVANHVSLLDVPVLLRALPPRLRRRAAPAMTAAYFRAWLSGEERLRGMVRAIQWFLASALFQAFLLPRRQGFRDSLRHAGALVDAGACPIVFPEGTRSTTGTAAFRPGIGLMASGLGVPVLPAFLAGLERVLPPGARWPRRARVDVRFGTPIRPRPGEGAAALTARIEAAVRALEGGTGPE